VNNERNAIETSYVFPLDDNSIVCKFSAELSSGGTIHGIVKEKNEAKVEYVRAVNEGRHAALMSQSTKSPDQFVCEIGNLMPNEVCIVRITYLTQIKTDPSGALRFVLPTTVCPHSNVQVYTPGRGYATEDLPWRWNSEVYLAVCVSH
jgi:hypothetical protein